MEQHDNTADELEQEADRMEEASDELEQKITEQREAWEQKTRSESVPGAQPVPKPGADPPPEDAGEDND
jgi:vacuolar-type H+-ATPase subunit I/STV1